MILLLDVVNKSPERGFDRSLLGSFVHAAVSQSSFHPSGTSSSKEKMQMSKPTSTRFEHNYIFRSGSLIGLVS